MAVTVAINGFGRIGRLVLRAIAEEGRTDLVPTRINASTSMNMDSVAHLFAYDSAHGRFAGQVEVSGNTLTVRHNGRVYGPIPVTFERDPRKLDLCGTDVAMECTGTLTSKEKCAPLLAVGARKVLISAPGDGVDAMIVYGVNNHDLKPDMTVISAASCTTNCLAPMAKVLHERFGILRGYMVTIHAYTNDQNTLDGSHRDARRARTAAVSAIPTSTGAARSIGQVMPELKGKLDGTSIRIPRAKRIHRVARCESRSGGHQGRHQRRLSGCRQGRAAGRAGLQHPPAGGDRFQPHLGLLHLRCDTDSGGGWGADPGDGVVRQ